MATTHRKMLVMMTALAFVGVALTALAPTAAAHDCGARNPEKSCGECPDGHVGTHYDLDTGQVYCWSSLINANYLA